MRVPIVILALVASPLIADVSAQGMANKAKDNKKKDECLMPGLRKGHDAIDWILKHFDSEGCVQTPPPPPPPPPPAPVPDPTPVPVPDPTPTPTPTPDPTPAPDNTLGSFSGTVFEDLDWSLMPDSGEPRLSGWTVQLLSNGTVKQSTLTTGNGDFLFKDAPIGTYTICVVPKTGYAQVPDADKTMPCANGLGRKVWVDADSRIWEGVNFAYYDTTAQ
jgi:hypothetical protein